jgi:NADH dehydrogenase
LQRYVYFSGAGVDHDHLSYPWLRAKREAEQAITDSGVPYTILRPSWVYGRGDSSMSKFVNMGRYLPAFPLLGDGSAPVNPIWIGDIAELVPVLLESEEAIGDKLTLGCPEQMTMRQVARTVLEELGMPRKPLVPQPKPLLKLAGAGAQFLPSSPLSPGSVDFLTMDVRLGQLPRDVYGIEIKPLREGLRASELLPTA